MNNHQKRVFAGLLCAVMAALLFVSSAYIVLAAGHPCCGKGCEVCYVTAKTEALLSGFVLFAAVLALSFAIHPSLQALLAREDKGRAADGTLVCWKVRLNN